MCMDIFRKMIVKENIEMTPDYTQSAVELLMSSIQFGGKRG